MRRVLLTFILLLPTALSHAESPPLDEQIQSVKQQALHLSERLSRIEQQLLYPDSTQINLFVSLAPDVGVTLQAVRVDIDGERVATHVYDANENLALRKGGVQRLYTGNLIPGRHAVQWQVQALDRDGGELRLRESLTLDKGDDAVFVEARIVADGPAQRGGVRIRLQRE